MTVAVVTRHSMRLGDIVIIVSCAEVPSSRYHASAAGFTPTVPGAPWGRAGHTREPGGGSGTGRSAHVLPIGAPRPQGRRAPEGGDARDWVPYGTVVLNSVCIPAKIIVVTRCERMPRHIHIQLLQLTVSVTPFYEATPLIYGADPRRGSAIRVSCVVLLHTVHTLQCSCCASMTPLHPRFKAGQS